MNIRSLTALLLLLCSRAATTGGWVLSSSVLAKRCSDATPLSSLWSSRFDSSSSSRLLATAETPTAEKPDPMQIYLRVKSIAENIHNINPPSSIEFDYASARGNEVRDQLVRLSTPYCVHRSFPEETLGSLFRQDDLEPSTWMKVFQRLDLTEDDKGKITRTLQLKQIPLEYLLKIATQAPFGKGENTVVDTTIRDAMEIPAAAMEGLFAQLPNKIMDAVREQMCAPSKLWEAKLYKMHLYGPGGKFDQHVDTMHASNHVATVVVNLPSEHEGGVLTVHYQGQVQEVDFSQNARMLQFAALFTDCLHQIQPVRSGWRVVLQYDLFEECRAQPIDEVGKDSQDAIINQDYEHEDEEMAEEDIWEVRNEMYQQIMDDVDYLPPPQPFHLSAPELIGALHHYLNDTVGKNEHMAIALRYRYAMPALRQGILKGVDRVLYDTIAASSLKCPMHLRAMLWIIEGEDESRYTFPQAKLLSLEDLGILDDDPQEEIKGKIHFIPDTGCPSGLIRLVARDYIEFAGNHVSPSYYAYHTACLILSKQE